MAPPVELALEPYEQHILGLVDGERSVLEICRESEIGESETLKVLYALLSGSLVKIRGKKVRAFDQDFVPADTLDSIIDGFNQMFSYVFRYMVREVGPIAENVLEKYLGGLREGRKDVFAGVKLQKDGTLDSATLERNASRLTEEARRSLLVDALNELLYAELLAVKRTLGPEHEAASVRAFRDRSAPPTPLVGRGGRCRESGPGAGRQGRAGGAACTRGPGWGVSSRGRRATRSCA